MLISQLRQILIINFNKRINSNKAKHALVENELNELSKKVEAISTKRLTKELINGYKILNGARYFSSGALQNNLIYFSYKIFFRFFTNTSKVLSCKSIGLSEESIENITTSDSNFAPNLINYYPLPDIKFNGHCLINNNNDASLSVVNLYICYTLDRWSRDLDTDFTLGNCLFGSVKLTKNSDLDKYKYSDYEIGFDSRSQFSFTNGSMGKNVIIFGADMSSYVHVDNKGKDILTLGERPTQGLNDTTLTAETEYLINFTQLNRRFISRLHYNGNDSFLFADTTKTCQLKAKDSEIQKYLLCLGDVSRDFTIDNMKKAGLKGSVKFFLLIIDLLILMKF